MLLKPIVYSMNLFVALASTATRVYNFCSLSPGLQIGLVLLVVLMLPGMMMVIMLCPNKRIQLLRGMPVPE